MPEPLSGLLAACLSKRPEGRPSDRDILRALTGGTSVELPAEGQPPTVDLRNAATLEYTKRLEENAPISPPYEVGRAVTLPPASPAAPATPRPHGRLVAALASNGKSAPRPWALAVAATLAVGGVTIILRSLPGTSLPTSPPATTLPVATVTVTTPAVVQATAVPSPTPIQGGNPTEIITPSISTPPSLSQTEQPAKEARITSAAVVGTWQGVYYCAQGLTGLGLTIAKTSTGELKANFRFFAHPDNSSVSAGTFAMQGTYADGTLTLYGHHWIDQPDDYVMVDLSAQIRSSYPTSIEGTVHASNSRCSTFSVERVSS